MNTSREHIYNWQLYIYDYDQQMHSDFSESLQKKAVIYAKDSLSHVRVGVCPMSIMTTCKLWVVF